MKPITIVEVRQINKERIRRASQQSERYTKADIAKETALSMATCSTALNEMLESGEVLKIDQTGFSIGRPADVFTYNPDFLHTLALCTTIRDGRYVLEYVIANALGQIVSREMLSPRDITMEALDELIASVRAKDPRVKIVGLGIPGQARDGYIAQCDILGLQRLDFGGPISEKHGVQVIVENDLNIIAYYLHKNIAGDAALENNFSALFFPDKENGYLGSGHIVNGHLLKGDTMLSGDLFRAAAAFGIPLDRQLELLSDRKAFLRFAAQMVVMIACTINPSHLVMMGNQLTEEELKPIGEICRQFISETDLPVMEVNNQTFDEYAEGLLRLTLDPALFPMLM